MTDRIRALFITLINVMHSSADSFSWKGAEMHRLVMERRGGNDPSLLILLHFEERQFRYFFVGAAE
jgi:hypothetical protein